MFKIQGVLFHIGLLQKFNSGMIKKEFIVSRTSAGAYPNIVFEILGNDIAKLDALPLNSYVEVTCDIHGKSYTAKNGEAKHFNVLRAYGIELAKASPVIAETSKSVKEVSADKAGSN